MQRTGPNAGSVSIGQHTRVRVNGRGVILAIEEHYPCQRGHEHASERAAHACENDPKCSLGHAHTSRLARDLCEGRA